MKSIPLRLALIAFLTALCAVAVFFKPIRLGKDLRGGVSLIYSVKIPPGSDPNMVLGQVIDVLKQRVNPQGVLDIGMQPQGTDRIEIVMPLPSAEVRELQKAYKDDLTAFMRQAVVGPTELEQALVANRAAESFGTAGTRGDELRELQAAFNERSAATKELEAARTAGADAAAISAIENRIVTAEITETRLRSKILGATLSETRVTKALALSTKPQNDLDPVTGNVRTSDKGEPLKLPPARTRELDAIKGEFPHLAPAVDGLVAKYDAYVAKRTGLDDPEDLMRLLRGAGVLTFHIAARASTPEVDVTDLREQLAKRGPRNTDSAAARWFEINDLRQWYETPEELAALQRDPVGYFAAQRDLVAATYAGGYYLLLYTSDAKSMTHQSGDAWALRQVYRTIDDRLGGAAVGFQLDGPGGTRMARLTAPHINQPMAIVLDNQVYTAPNLNSAISGSGVITGKFTAAEVSYLIRVLTAGSLEASLSPDPISMNVLGPSIGAENLELGRDAIILSIAFTGLLMLAYYFLAGVIANVGLAINAIMTFGVMAWIDGTFTLPGLAGIALAVAMAVDANVLIYERIREEVMNRGESLRAAIQLGYGRALPPIIDGNLTNLLVVVVLYQFGATEVKGFALTMLIGITSSLFTSLFLTRTLFMILTEWFGARKLPMLPTVAPVVARILTPRIDWMALRMPLWATCAAVGLFAVSLVFSRGKDIFETEFRGGVAMTLDTRKATAGEKADEEGNLILNRVAVEERVREIGMKAGAADPILHELRSANILTVGNAGEAGESNSFQIRVGNPTVEVNEAEITPRIVDAVARAFVGEINARLALSFDGSADTPEARDHTKHTFPLERDLLGDSIGRPEVKSEPTGDFRGGVAIVVNTIDPPATAEDLVDRITRMRTQPDFSDTAGRKTRVIGLTPKNPENPAEGFTSAVVLVADPGISSLTSEFEAWDRQLARSEWQVVRAAFTSSQSLREISSFSPIVAENLAATAVVAVILSLVGMLMYIWVRFGSFRYSSAAVTALVFNVTCCLGFLAAAPWLAHTAIGRALYIEEFRIDLNVVAALLTIVGYAINDTIVILDRIRENKGKLSFATRACVNDSINQTFARTVLTGGSTFATAVILIVLGGTGIRPFAYTFFVGLIAGTISSVVIAALMIYSRREEEEERRRAELGLPEEGADDGAIVPA
jgi:SecD/SecF fusion protein